MDAKELPAQPSLEQYKKQAKDLLKAHNAGRPEAAQRIRDHHPHADKLTKAALADAQIVIAREHGFESWPKFAKHVAALARDPAFIWKSAEEALINADAAALDVLLRENERMFREEQAPSFGSGGLRPDYSGGDVRTVLASNHHFESWDQFADHVEAGKRKDSQVAQFEAAVDAIVRGDAAMLQRLLQQNPSLIRARSTRKHHATLLHYAGSNGVEYFRQKCPKNIVAMVKILLGAGAEVDATADMYGKDTTLGLAATSIHPVISGVQIPLLETLLDAGAAMDSMVGASSVVAGCLHNGRPQAAEFFAARGARLDLEAAAGVGRLDLVRSFFTPDGSLKPGATKAQMNDGFMWACEYGRTAVVEFLLDQGMDVRAAGRPHGQTGLHWATYGGHMDIVELLLQRNAPVDVKDERFQGTPLEWAIHGWRDRPIEGPRRPYDELVVLLVSAGAQVSPELLTDERVRADAAMLAALGGR
jgi:ankyrin repeat protein